MNELNLLTEFVESILLKKEQLSKLYIVLDYAFSGLAAQDKHCNEIKNIVLNEHPFYASKTYANQNTDIKIGDRINDFNLDFLLSKPDFNNYEDLVIDRYKMFGIIDTNEEYIIDWNKFILCSKSNLINFIFNEILPADLSAKLTPHSQYDDSIIDLIRPLINSNFTPKTDKK